MSILYLILLCVLDTVLSRNVMRYNLDDASEHFETFIETYGKAYGKAEKASRYQIFMKNLEKVNYLNERSDNARFGITKFSDLTHEEFIQRYTGYKSSNSTADFTITGKTKSEFKLSGAPDKFDWRDQGVVSAVKDQGQCGSCWAFSVVGNVESVYTIKTQQSAVLSEQQLVDCAQTGCSGCNGGDPLSACQYIQSSGSMSEDSYPYTGTAGQCKYDANSANVKIGSCTSIQVSEDELADKLASTAPLSITVDAGVLQTYKGGIITGDTCQGSQTDHAVLLVGYGTDNGNEYWSVKNSWGASWGESGYFRIQRGVNCLLVNNNPAITAQMN